MIPNLTRQAYNEFQPKLSSISCPVELGVNPGRQTINLGEFTPILSRISCPVEFDQARNTAKIWSKSIEMIPNLTRQAYNEFQPKLSSISCPVEFDQSNWE